ncbi:IS200/IS605 family transposase [Streptomyces sp. P6-2-1]|uniref:IS200/IS605 family transposase n=1 Tax=unclassified Streptomyces TaxID=2593676 RepID=UPI003D35ECA1
MLITDAPLRRIEETTRPVSTDFERELMKLHGEDNHVHLLADFPPEVAVTKLVNSLKGVSSRRLRQEFPDLARHYWRANKPWPGPAPPSPKPSAAPRSPKSGSTSKRRTGRHERSPAPPPRAVMTLHAMNNARAISGSAGADATTLRVATIRLASPPA